MHSHKFLGRALRRDGSFSTLKTLSKGDRAGCRESMEAETRPQVEKRESDRGGDRTMDETRMATATQLKALFKSIEAGDEERLYSVALQIAAHEARHGHERFAKELRDLIDSIRQKHTVGKPAPAPIPLAQPRGELAGVLSVSYPSIRLLDVSLPPDLVRRLRRVVHEQRQNSRLA